jgi:hypothetical protein
MTKKEPQPQPVKSVEEMILDYKLDKYTAIPLASFWAKELRRREENRHLTNTEILELALRDVLGGTVDWKNVRKSMTAAPAVEAEPAAPSAGKKSKE